MINKKNKKYNKKIKISHKYNPKVKSGNIRKQDNQKNLNLQLIKK